MFSADSGLPENEFYFMQGISSALMVASQVGPKMIRKAHAADGVSHVSEYGPPAMRRDDAPGSAVTDNATGR